MFENGQLAAARFHEPLIIGVGQDDYFLSSDVLGFIEHTDNAIYIENGNFVILDKNKFQILDFDGEHVKIWNYQSFKRIWRCLQRRLCTLYIKRNLRAT